MVMQPQKLYLYLIIPEFVIMTLVAIVLTIVVPKVSPVLQFKPYSD